jgi:hypothetical protein
MFGCTAALSCLRRPETADRDGDELFILKIRKSDWDVGFRIQNQYQEQVLQNQIFVQDPNSMPPGDLVI